MSNQELSKAYDPSQVEDRWYRFWTDQGYFHADPAARKAPFTIVIPPPNVTGSLHMGHALSYTIQDILIRWKRMQAYNAMWLPGTDHAGIATQLVVERQLMRSEKKSRHDLGREAFLERVWAWKQQYGGRITEQLRTLGCSLDWERERFTMDEGLSKAVREAFARLYEEGLIYRAKRLINWCSRCYTALSDLEVEHSDEQGSLWHISYPVVDGKPGEALTVATTRPETMLGDTAVAVHPEDPRYRHLIGKEVHLPLAGRDLMVVGDAELVDRELGTGAVKLTPGHDFNDFEAGVRHDLEQLSIFDQQGRVIAPAPEKYRGLTIADARKAVLADLEAGGHLVKTEPHALSLGRCQRCDTVVEPMLSLQWFVKTKPLAEPAIAAVESGKTRFVPENWTKVYMHWMTNIKDWCISRQLWWGHRIPAWHCGACQEITVARETPAACGKCGSAELKQDEDVLDTWFSSGLWPFSTLGWPEQTRDLKNFYPNSVMETGHDILFFWVARMMMLGIHFMKKPPFHTVFLHAMVVDEHGDKMSKVKGNVIDPLDVIHGATMDEMCAKAEAAGAPKQALGNIKKAFPEGIPAAGADALRFALASQAAQGRNIRLSLTRIETFRHFANKIWNASRFALMNLKGFDPDRFTDSIREDVSTLNLGLAERWILSELTRVSKAVDDALEEFRINDAAQLLYKFIWNELCDWYIELAKPSLYEVPEQRGDVEAARKRRLAQGTLTTCLETALRLLHPFMPYLSEEIWQKLPKPLGTPASIMVTLYPIPDQQLIDEEAERIMGVVKDTVSAIRTLRAEYNVPPQTRVRAVLRAPEGGRREIALAQQALIESLGRANIEMLPAGAGEGDVPGHSAHAVVGGELEVYLPLEGLIDLGAELSRLEKDLVKAKADIEYGEKKLGNESFVSRAPADILDKERARLAEAQGRAEKLTAALARLK